MNKLKLLMLLLCALPSLAAGANWPENSQFSSLESAPKGDILVFKTGSPPSQTEQKYQTGLFNLEILGSFDLPNNAPYLIVSAVSCKDCKEKSIFIFQPNAPMAARKARFTYPGRIFDPKSGALLADLKSFFGNCLNPNQDIFLMFQQEKVDRKKHLQSSVLSAQPSPDYLEEKLIERRMPKITTVQKRVKLKQCKQIAGFDRRMSHKRPRITPVKEEEEETDETKPSETKAIEGPPPPEE